MKNYEIVDKILRYHPQLTDYQGCDEYKYGNPRDECTGVAVALVPTVEVLRQMADRGLNLLITHEPIFYQTPDFPEWKGNFANSVYAEKCRLLSDHHLTVWRDHDHLHAHRPDGIFTGVIKYLGWEEYYRPAAKGEMNFSYVVELPATTVGGLGKLLQDKLGLNGLRYMGRPDDRVSRVALVGHLFPNCFYQDGIDEQGYYQDYAMKLMAAMEKENGIEAIIPGEIIEWTVLSYIRDALAFGRIKACYNVGHFNLEELGMRYMKDWLDELLDRQLPVVYIPTGDGFSYL